MDLDDDRMARPLDACLHLMDRQLVDVDGRLAGKVDDLELTRGDAGELAVTAILCGPAVLVPRLGGGLGRWGVERWRHLARQYADRTTPGRLGLDAVDRLTSAVHLRVGRDGMLDRTPERRGTDGRSPLRVGGLSGMTVVLPDGSRSRVLDVRLAQRRAGALPVTGLLVGRGGPGSLLGYDRDAEQGPALVAAVVRRWHSDSRLVPWEAVEVHWDAGRVVVGRLPEGPQG